MRPDSSRGGAPCPIEHPRGGEGRRIAIALPNLLPFGGVERIAVVLAAQFLDRGYAVDLVLAQEANDLKGTVPPGCGVVNLHAHRLAASVFPLARYLRTKRPAAMAASMWPFTTIAVVAKYMARSDVRLVVRDHNPLSVQYGGSSLALKFALRASLQAYRCADARIAVSSGVADDLSRLSGIARDKFQVIHNPLWIAPPDGDLEEPKPSVLWGRSAGPRILTVGRLKAQKNHTLLLSAFAELADALPSARLAILGTGEQEAQTRALIGDLGLDDRVILPGHVHDPSPWYRSADLFVISSDYEGFGNVIVEALAAGVPVVSTDCPSGPTEILEGGRWGRLVPVGDKKALATAMHEALRAERDREALKRRAADFAPAIAAGKYLDVLVPNRSRLTSTHPRNP